MSRTFRSIECALNEEILRVAREKHPNAVILETVEPAVVKQAISDILSLKPKAPIPGTDEELQLFEKIYCLMSMKNRKWLSEAQVSLPYSKLIAPERLKEAELKSRLYGVDESIEAPPRRQDKPTDIELRNDFLELLQKCVSQDDMDKFPHLVSLFDNGFSGRADTPVKEVGAWRVLSLFQQRIFRAERQVRPIPPQGITLPEMSKRAYIESVHDEIHLALPNLVAASPWRTAMDEVTASTDSLFARLSINVAVNRFVLEQSAYSRRVQAAAPIQVSLARELEKNAPEGFLEILLAEVDDDGGHIDYGKIVQQLLADALTERKSSITRNMYLRIEAQVDEIINSTLLDEFSGDVEMNVALSSYPVLTKAMGCLALAWSYACKGAYPEDDPGVHVAVSGLISRRSPIVKAGQHMVSLRRLVSTLMNTQTYRFPSAIRVEKHIEHVVYLRKFLIAELLGAFKDASLAQWDCVLRAEFTNEQFNEFLVAIKLPDSAMRSMS